MNKKIKAVIFDLDGTLLNTLDDLMYSTNYALEKYNLPIRTKEEIKNFVGNGVDLLIKRAMNYTHEEIYEDVLNCFKEHYQIHSMDHIYKYDGIEELLKELKKQNILIAVVTNKFHEAAKDIIKTYFNDYVNITIGVSNDVRKKPSPDMCNKVLSSFNINANQAIFVGDSDVDYQTGVNSDLFVVSVTWGFKTKEFLQKIGSKNIIDTPLELLKYIE